MKKILFAMASLLLLASCEEWQPVTTFDYTKPEAESTAELKATHTIRELCAMYNTGTPWSINRNIVIAGQVSTTDQPGNFYKSFYIQDETAGIEIKVGKNSLYNNYQPGQWIYVKCLGLCLGMYGYKSGNNYGQGMVQIGSEDPTGSYETSYMESPLLIDAHVLKGKSAPEVAPAVISESDLPGSNDTQVTNEYVGKLVTLKGLKYSNEIFALLYLDSSKDKSSTNPGNRLFLSDGQWGVTTWAMSKQKMTEYICSGIWDAATIGSGATSVGTVAKHRGKKGDYPDIEKAAYSVSQYFKMGNETIQIRTSGYCNFSDTKIPSNVLSGEKTINVTGILTLYQGSIQLTVNSAADFTYSDGTPLYK